MKILLFSKYSRMGASSRVRSYQYLPYYKEAGITCKISPLFNDKYLKALYIQGRPGKLNIVACYIKRLLTLFTIPAYNLVIIEKELLPYFPAVIERILAFFGVRYMVDYDDAIFHNYNLHPNKIIRRLLQYKINTVMRNAYTVVAGNEYIASFAQQAKAKKIVIIPTVINTGTYTVKKRQPGNTVVIGWIGSPTTLKYLQQLLPVFKKLSLQYSFNLAIVGGQKGIGLDGYEVIQKWSEAEEVNLIQQFDIGVMPLEDSPWERGKCGYKLIQYMGCGLPVVGSPVGVNNTIIQHGINGYKATTHDEWFMYLEQLIIDGQSRALFGQAGRKLAEQEFDTAKAFGKWLKLVKSADNNA